jgi:tRNA(His) guanylyltransferase
MRGGRYGGAAHVSCMSRHQQFKDLEGQVETQILHDNFVVIRLDGKAFHTFTKGFERPFDKTFAATMDSVAAHLCTVVDGAMFAYVQSDEISVVFSDMASPTTQMWLNGRVQKMASVAASNATAQFMRRMPTELFPIFDARMHVLAGMGEIAEYVAWRRADAGKNAVSMAAGVLHNHKELLHINTEQRRALLVGTPYETLPDKFLFGRIVSKHFRPEEVTFWHGKAAEFRTVEALRGEWVVETAAEDVIARVLVDSDPRPATEV